MTNKKNNIKKEVPNFIDLLYMTPGLVNAKDIAMLFEASENITVQLWEEMNVIELELPNKNTVDFEPIEANFKDPSDVAFIKNRNIKTIFAINIAEDDLATVTPYFEQLVQTHSGFVCGDTVDFTPVYAGTTKLK